MSLARITIEALLSMSEHVCAAATIVTLHFMMSMSLQKTVNIFHILSFFLCPNSDQG